MPSDRTEGAGFQDEGRVISPAEAGGTPTGFITAQRKLRNDAAVLEGSGGLKNTHHINHTSKLNSLYETKGIR